MAEMATAKEIERQANRIQEQLVKYQDASKVVKIQLERLQNLTQSEDSQLGGKIQETHDLISTLEEKVVLNYTKLADIMKKWSTETIANEEQTASEVAATNTGISDAINELNSLDI